MELPRLTFCIGRLNMAGNNQEKRRIRNIAHAEKVWVRAQLQAAQAKNSLDEALKVVRDKKEELTDDQLAMVETEAQNRYDELEAYVMKAKDEYLAKMSEYASK